MSGLKTWTAKAGNCVLIATAETVELAIRNITYETGVVLTNADMIPLPTHHRHVRVLKVLEACTNCGRELDNMCCDRCGIVFRKASNK